MLSCVGETHLALLIAIGQELQAVGGDSQELRVVLVEEGHHLLQPISQAHRHLGALLVEQQVVQRGDGVEQDRLHRGTGEQAEPM